MQREKNILIIEPSLIIREGIFSILSRNYPNSKIIKTCCIEDGIYTEDKIFDVVIVGTSIFLNNMSLVHRLEKYFENTPIIGIVSSYFDKHFYSHFIELINLYETEKSLINILNNISIYFNNIWL